MFAFEGGYHGRTLGASSITSSYRYRRRFGHFGDRAQFVPFLIHSAVLGMTSEEYADHIVSEFARKFETNITPSGIRKPISANMQHSILSLFRGLVVMSSHLQTSSQA